MKRNQNKLKKLNKQKNNSTKIKNNKSDTNLEPLWYGLTSCMAVLIIFYIFL